MDCEMVILILVLLAILIHLHNMYSGSSMYVNSEGFNVDSQNYVYNNKFEVADSLKYGGKEPEGMYRKPVAPLFDASSNFGVNQNSGSDVFDVRGYDNTRSTASFSDVDLFTQRANDAMMKAKFERTYMLDPSGEVAQYDISNMKVDKKCCPAQYGVDFMGNDNCDFANKYVANNYSGMNYNSDGVGCPCVDVQAATWWGGRGGNAV